MSSNIRAYAIAVLSAGAAAFSQVPYNWAHITSGALSAALAVTIAGSTAFSQAVNSRVSKISKRQYWEGNQK